MEKYPGLIPMAIVISLALSWALSTPATAREIVDMAGRRVEIPDTIASVYSASPPATYMLYAIAPDLIAGLNYAFHPAELDYLIPAMATLPVVGGWFGQGRAPNQETLLEVRPDIMLVWKWKTSAMNEKIEQVADRLKLPLVYICIDRLEDWGRALAFMGRLLQQEDRADKLQAYADRTMKSVWKSVAAIPENRRVSVYYAQGTDGLMTDCDVSVHAELIPLAGGRNVFHCQPQNDFGMERVTIEQVMLFHPDVIIAHEKQFVDQVYGNPIWESIPAVRGRRVHSIPRLPFSWFDRPPSFMRLLGIQWLTHLLYPDRYAFDPVADTRLFYRLFLGVELDDELLAEVLAR